jgi:hypothetical protein
MVRTICFQAERTHAAGPHVLACLAGLACALAGGCDRSNEESEQSRQCARFCDLLEVCDDGTDVLDCRRHCEADEVRSGAYFRARADCADEQSCNLWVGEVDSQGDDVCSGDDCSLNECVERSLLQVELSSEQERSCKVISSVLGACDSALESTEVAAECARIAPRLSENYLADSETCVLSKCSEIEPCMSELADVHGTDLRVFTGMFSPR